MKLNQIKLLTDENISPQVIACLRRIGIDTLDTKEKMWFGTDDETLLNIAYQQQRFILTHDSDFGTLAVNQNKPCYGILHLRLKNIKPGNVSHVCEDLFQKDIEIVPHSIWVIEETRIRIRQLLDEEQVFETKLD
jgi:predicted nuclease of predicted toxin-antitoxin system